MTPTNLKAPLLGQILEVRQDINRIDIGLADGSTVVARWLPNSQPEIGLDVLINKTADGSYTAVAKRATPVAPTPAAPSATKPPIDPKGLVFVPAPESWVLPDPYQLEGCTFARNPYFNGVAFPTTVPSGFTGSLKFVNRGSWYGSMTDFVFNYRLDQSGSLNDVIARNSTSEYDYLLSEEVATSGYVRPSINSDYTLQTTRDFMLTLLKSRGDKVIVITLPLYTAYRGSLKATRVNYAANASWIGRTLAQAQALESPTYNLPASETVAALWLLPWLVDQGVEVVSKTIAQAVADGVDTSATYLIPPDYLDYAERYFDQTSGDYNTSNAVLPWANLKAYRKPLVDPLSQLLREFPLSTIVIWMQQLESHLYYNIFGGPRRYDLAYNTTDTVTTPEQIAFYYQYQANDGRYRPALGYGGVPGPGTNLVVTSGQAATWENSYQNSYTYPGPPGPTWPPALSDDGYKVWYPDARTVGFGGYSVDTGPKYLNVSSHFRTVGLPPDLPVDFDNHWNIYELLPQRLEVHTYRQCVLDTPQDVGNPARFFATTVANEQLGLQGGATVYTLARNYFTGSIATEDILVTDWRGNCTVAYFTPERLQADRLPPPIPTTPATTP